MAHILDDVQKFKELALAGVPKVISGEDFLSAEEQEATTFYINRFGLKLDPYIGSQLDQITDRIEYNNTLINGITGEILNTFRGAYGI